MLVPFVDLKIQHQQIKKEIDDAIKKALDRSQFIQGEEVHLFENEFAKYLSVGHCVSLNSGTDALILGMRSLDLKRGSEILVPANTYFATALAATENDFKPVFVDTDNSDYGMDLSDLKKKINSRTAAIIIVHLYGQPEKIDEIKKIIRNRPKIHLIEDVAQSHGALYKKKRVGTFGTFGIFSFYPSKNLGAYGDGGAVVTKNSKLANKLKMIREYGQKSKNVHVTAGVNSRLDTLQAAILRIKLKYLEGWNKKRQINAKIYDNLLKDLKLIKTPHEFINRKSIYHLYVIRVPKRDKLLDYLSKKGVKCQIHYPRPLHLQGSFSYLGYKKGDFPNAERISSEIISLPMFPELKKESIKYVVSQIKSFYEKGS